MNMEAFVSVVDVYDSAAIIGKDFEYLIEQYGVDAVTDLMPKVIRILEQLELLATRYEKENSEITELQLLIKRLTKEKTDRLTEKQKYEQELEQIEDSWHKESKELLNMIGKLQDENRRLHSVLSEKSEGQAASEEKQDEEMKLMSTLKDTVNRQRTQIRALENENEEKSSSIEAVQSHAEVLARDNARLRLSSASSRTQVSSLLEKKQSLERALQERSRQMDAASSVRSRLERRHSPETPPVPAAVAVPMEHQIGKMAKTLTDYRVRLHISKNQTLHLVEEKSELQATLQEREQHFSKVKEAGMQPCIRCRAGSDAEGSTAVSGNLKEAPGSIDCAGTPTNDVDDQTKPRFTLSELREVLLERNSLKARLIEAEEELAALKARQAATDKSIESASMSSSSAAVTAAAVELDEYEGAVQGPINKEPWEKLYPEASRAEFGIRKFFERFPIELPETIRVNIIPGELADFASSRASGFWDFQVRRRDHGNQQPNS